MKILFAILVCMLYANCQVASTTKYQTNCNDGHGKDLPCRRGPPGYYFKCRKSLNYYITESKSCKKINTDAQCSSKFNDVCAPLQPTPTEPPTKGPTSSTTPAPKYETNCNDNHGDSKPCREGPQGYYYKCRKSLNAFITESKSCKKLSSDPVCRDKNVCKPKTTPATPTTADPTTTTEKPTTTTEEPTTTTEEPTTTTEEPTTTTEKPTTTTEEPTTTTEEPTTTTEEPTTTTEKPTTTTEEPTTTTEEPTTTTEEPTTTTEKPTTTTEEPTTTTEEPTTTTEKPTTTTEEPTTTTEEPTTTTEEPTTTTANSAVIEE